MTNAKREFLDHVLEREVLCAYITFGWDEDKPEDQMNLKINYTSTDYEAFLISLDFNYDEGFGGQTLFGTIWYKDGTWSSRGEYDGSEWWEHNIVPDIPEHLGKAIPPPKMETLTFAVPYEKEFAKRINAGWGCGYVAIPLNHDFLKDEGIVNDGTDYIQVPDLDEEITYTAKQTINGTTYMVLGFDTAHVHNGPQHDFEYVISQTMKMKLLVDSYQK